MTALIIRRPGALSILFILLAHAGAGMPLVGAAPATNGGIPLLPREREIALAESAGPPGAAKGATIYILAEAGYTIAREGTSGFSCLVVRTRPDTLEPICYDPEGTATRLPADLAEARLRGEGKPEEVIRREISEGFRTGTYRAPRRAGIAYMLSEENQVFNGEKVIPYPPHVMIYAPYVTNKEIGADFSSPWHPWVLEEGTPGAYIMVVVRTDPPDRRSGASGTDAESNPDTGPLDGPHVH